MNRTWKNGLLALPSVGASMLPKLACPACWPAYAGLLSSVGLGFLISTVYLLPLTAVSLLLAVAALAFRANKRRGYGPFAVGLVAGSAVLLGKFVWESNLTVHSALGLLVSLRCGMRGRSAICLAKQQPAPNAKEKMFDELNIKERNTMATKKKIEVFSAGCSTCKETIEVVKHLAGSSHEAAKSP